MAPLRPGGRSVRYGRAMRARGDEELDRLNEKVRGPAPRMGEREWFPDHAAERRAAFRRTTPADRVAEAIALSELATSVAAAATRR